MTSKNTAGKNTSPETPLMKQYNAIKAKYPDAILLFRVGDFYETFHQDAVKTAAVLGIVLTKRGAGSATETELAGFPYHSLETYLPKLVRAGLRVAICDQLEDPKLTKTIVKRGVTELITPGVAFNDQILDHKTNNFLCAINWGTAIHGIAFIDVSTGEFMAGQGNVDYIERLLQSFNPSEIIFAKPKQKLFTNQFGTKYYTYGLDEWVFTIDYSMPLLLKHFNTLTLKGFGIDDLDEGAIAAGSILYYLNETQHERLSHITSLSRIQDGNFIWLDKFTIRNLELLNTGYDKAKSLIDVIDKSISPMGARMLRRWLLMPLKDLHLIQERQEVVNFFVHHEDVMQQLNQQLKRIGDLERLISKVAIGKVSARELIQLKRALLAIEPIKDMAITAGHHQLKIYADQLNACSILTNQINQTITDEPPAIINKGGTIKNGINEALDALRNIAGNGKAYLVELQKREAESTGIPSLKVSYNHVFGYYIEVTNTHKNKVPTHWHRKQTLANAERYITPELKQYEEEILGAEEKILGLEEKIFADLVLDATQYIKPIQQNAIVIAQLDCLQSFATTAIAHHYVKPHLNDSFIIDIKAGRHPVLEQQLSIEQTYVANDVYLDNETQQIIIITGPNMAGKSALLRQTALICLLAQTGSFVPAQQAHLGLVDKIFTRVGASDNISSGESTFMVEMNETASILNNISARSLILLDEIGRGTSTYDGISIAWAIAEYLHQHHTKAKTLFATHYHELNEMTHTFNRIKNFNVAIKEVENRILFIRKLVPGGSEHSFGIHVAKMAGMPAKVISTANNMLAILEKSHNATHQIKSNRKVEQNEAMQLSFFQLDDPMLEQIREEILKTDINTLTPVEALLKLHDIKKLLGK
ncbi:MAG: DNA mismatch repair protein MutS [Bacteroidia bacterium]|nr:DNA mismatch repair protein MutS [Bacteroidia bacterium]